MNVTEPPDNEQEMIFHLKLEGHGSTTAVISCTNETCAAGGLTANREYKISVNACIKAKPSICGTFSDVAKIYTVPQGKYKLKNRNYYPEYITIYCL